MEVGVALVMAENSFVTMTVRNKFKLMLETTEA